MSGFSFDNCHRNELVIGKDTKLNGGYIPTARKTGTTICGVVYNGGVVLGADTRATEGEIVADKNCQKIHFMANNIYCCGAGTAADTEKVTRMISARLNLHRMDIGRVPRVTTACKYLAHYLYGYRGHIGAALVLGGVDSTGSNLYIVSPNGYASKLPFTSMGSGSLAAMAMFERSWRPNLSRDGAMQLVRDAIAGGVFNDLGSGSNIDLCVIEHVPQLPALCKVDFLRPYEIANEKGKRQGDYRFKRGATKVLSQKVHTVEYHVVATREHPVPMEA